jgi:hypothetical protein
MISFAEALSAEREKWQRGFQDDEARREVGRVMLKALLERLTAEPLPGWFFTVNGDEEIVVAHTKGGLGLRHRIGSWVVDSELRLKFGEETTEWITPESWTRVLDEALTITAKLVVEAETRLRGATKSAAAI